MECTGTQLEGTTGMGSEAEEIAVEMAATGAVGQRLEKLDESFLMALDYMIQQAERDDKVVACELSSNFAVSRNTLPYHASLLGRIRAGPTFSAWDLLK